LNSLFMLFAIVYPGLADSVFHDVYMSLNNITKLILAHSSYAST
jgi:hypothetical protein